MHSFWRIRKGVSFFPSFIQLLDMKDYSCVCMCQTWLWLQWHLFLMEIFGVVEGKRDKGNPSERSGLYRPSPGSNSGTYCDCFAFQVWPVRCGTGTPSLHLVCYFVCVWSWCLSERQPLVGWGSGKGRTQSKNEVCNHYSFPAQSLILSNHPPLPGLSLQYSKTENVA